MKVLFTTNIPAPYMVDYLNELGKYCDLTAVFEKDRSSERNKNWENCNFKNFKGIILRGIATKPDAALSLGIIRFLFADYDKRIVSNLTTPTGVLLIVLLKIFRIPYSVQSEGGFYVTGKGFKEKVKFFLFNKAERFYSGMKFEHDYFLPYGLSESRHVKYPFSSLYKEDIQIKVIENSKKAILKEKYKIKNCIVVVFVGRFIKSKGIDVLLKAFKQLNDSDIQLLCIGGIPNTELLELQKSLNINNVTFIDMLDKETLFEYYQLSDIFVLPTLSDTWGLVINEAMANGLPIITTNKCVAGLELIKNEINGYIIQADNISELSKALEKTCSDETLRAKMGKNNIQKIQDYSIENMAKIIAEDLLQ